LRANFFFLFLKFAQRFFIFRRKKYKRHFAFSGRKNYLTVQKVFRLVLLDFVCWLVYIRIFRKEI